MLKPTDIRPGNIILFDHNDRRRPAVPLIRGIVEEVRKDKVVLKGDIMLGYDRIEGLPIDEDLLFILFGIDTGRFGIWGIKREDYRYVFRVYQKGEGIYLTEIKYIHEFQNIYDILTCGSKLTFTVPESPPIHPQQ